MSTIKQIAELAGVSPTTVANVIHGKTEKVSVRVRDRIIQILKEENYAPNQGALMLKRSRSHIVGIILFMEPRSSSSSIEDPFVSRIIGTLETEIREAGYFMMLRCTSNKDEVLHFAATWKLAGLVILCMPSEISSAVAKSVASPVVFVDCYFEEPGAKYYSIKLDDEKGGFEMTRYLLDMGHIDIAFLANAADFPSVDSARYDGYRNAFKEAGLAIPRDKLFILSKNEKERLRLYLWFAENPGFCTALFFSADYYAAEAIDCLAQLGLKIPGQLSIAGFDDNLLSRLQNPKITTVHQDVVKKGRLAAKMLFALVKKEIPPQEEIILPIRIVARESVSNRIIVS